MIIKQSRVKMFAMAAACFAAVWLCDYAVEQAWVTGRTAGKVDFGYYIFAALGAFALLKSTFMRALVAHIKPEGLYAPGISNKIIAWSDIEAINSYKHSGSESLAISLFAGSSAEANAKTTASIGKAITSANGFKGYTIPLGTTGVTAQAFMESVRDAMDNKSPARATQKSGVVTRYQTNTFGKRAGA